MKKDECKKNRDNNAQFINRSHTRHTSCLYRFKIKQAMYYD